MATVFLEEPFFRKTCSIYTHAHKSVRTREDKRDKKPKRLCSVLNHPKITQLQQKNKNNVHLVFRLHTAVSIHRQGTLRTGNRKKERRHTLWGLFLFLFVYDFGTGGIVIPAPNPGIITGFRPMVRNSRAPASYSELASAFDAS